MRDVWIRVEVCGGGGGEYTDAVEDWGRLVGGWSGYAKSGISGRLVECLVVGILRLVGCCLVDMG